MKKTIALFILLLTLVVFTAQAQMLNQVSISDQFTSGERGGNLSLGTSGEYYSVETITNSGGASGTIVYVNTWAGQLSKAGEVESPVMTVTTANTSPDRSFTLAAIPANTRPGATSPATAVYVGDDGGYNALAFGDLSSTNYSAQIDMYCPDYSGVSGAGGSNFTRMGMAVRANYIQAPSVDGPSSNTYPMGSYALLYESSIKTIFAVKFFPLDASTDMRHISLASTVSQVQVVSSQVVSQGWHTLKINANGNRIQFYVDGSQLGSDFVDTTNPYLTGNVVLHYRASNAFDGVAATDTQAVFDNMSSSPLTSVNDWTQM